MKDEGIQQLNAWYQTPLGKTLGVEVTDALKKVSGSCFGQLALQMAVPSHYHWLKQFSFQHYYQWVHHQAMLQSVLMPGLVSEPDQLPFPEESFDLVLLPHLLEYVADPYSVLHEVTRVLTKKGQLVIVGINPFGLWGLVGWCRRWFSPPPWRGGQTLSVYRARHYLNCLNLEVVSINNIFHCPPIANGKWLKRFWWLDPAGRMLWPYSGAIYVLHARKCEVGITPLKPLWQEKSNAIAGRFIETRHGSKGVVV